MWSQADLDFWAERKAPRAVREAVEGRKSQLWRPHRLSIHEVINAHVPKEERPRIGLAAGNLISLLKSYRNRGLVLAKELERLERNPGCTDAKARSAFACKWLRKINQRA